MKTTQSVAAKANEAKINETEIMTPLDEYRQLITRLMETMDDPKQLSRLYTCANKISCAGTCTIPNVTQTPAEKTVKAEKVAKIADDLTVRISDRLDRLQAVLEDTSINDLRAFDDDTEHYNPYPALCMMSLSVTELDSIGRELNAMVKLIRELAA